MRSLGGCESGGLESIRLRTEIDMGSLEGRWNPGLEVL